MKAPTVPEASTPDSAPQSPQPAAPAGARASAPHADAGQPQPATRPTRHKRTRTRIYPRVRTDLAERLTELAAAHHTTENALVEAALDEYLDRTSDISLVLRRLDRNGRAHARTQRDLAFLLEAFSVFVKLWLAHTPAIPQQSRPAARTLAEARYKKWLDHVVEQFTGGHRFVDDLPQEPVADDSELTALARR